MPSSRSAPQVGLLLDLTRSLIALATRSVDAADGKVSLPQFRGLYVLQRTGPCNAGSLAEQLGSHPSTVTRLCDRLVKLGYVTRQVRADNRREIELDVTPAGQQIVDAVMHRRAGEFERLLSALDADTLGHLRLALPALVAAAEDQHGQLAEGRSG